MKCNGPWRAQVDAVVRSQYAFLRRDAVVGSLFAQIKPGGEHEAKIADFWWSSFGGRPKQPRSFDMLAKHRALNLTAEAFTIWLCHLRTAVDAHLAPEHAAMWMKRAELIGVNLKRLTLGGGKVSARMEPKCQ
jgi:truncated hemoglobin YjbI